MAITETELNAAKKVWEAERSAFVQSIVSLPEAKGKEKLAAVLAGLPGMDAATAKSALQFAGVEVSEVKVEEKIEEKVEANPEAENYAAGLADAKLYSRK